MSSSRLRDQGFSIDSDSSNEKVGDSEISQKKQTTEDDSREDSPTAYATSDASE
jgi:hypothetical protein